MTTEPKFIPNEAVPININNTVKFNARLVDCVGYLVNNAIGHLENDTPRMVKTPWADDEIPFEAAAEIGTKKVIEDHSTIGILITTDGSFTDIPRDDYISAEERVAVELKAINKPFIIIVNSSNPSSDKCKEICESLEKKYSVTSLPIDCSKLTIDDINNILNTVLYEFPTTQINIKYPEWIDALDNKHWLKKEILNEVKTTFTNVSIIKNVNDVVSSYKANKIITNCSIQEINLGTGIVTISLSVEQKLYYNILTELSGQKVTNEFELFYAFNQFSKAKIEYDKLAPAIEQVKSTGYGIITPTIDDLILDEPEMVKQGSKFGVKLKAKAPSIHLIKTEVETEISPIVGSEKQSEDLVKYLLSQFENEPKQIWESNIFGRSLHELVNEGLQNKLSRMPEEAQSKLQQTLEKIVNEGSGGLICIIL